MKADVCVLLAEGDPFTRAGLRLAMQRAGFALIVDADGHAAAIDAAREHDLDIALVAADLPDGGIETACRLVALHPRLRVIVITADPGGEELVAAVLAGAVGYLPKDMRLERLPNAIDGVLRGEVALPRQHAGHLLAELRGRDIQRERLATGTGAVLTDREWEALLLLGEGASTAEIARRLRISQVTVRRHVSTLLAKLGVDDRESAARLVRRSPD